MNFLKKLFAATGRCFEAVAKARMNSHLLLMGREEVERMGFSYEALRQGPSAWPWRMDISEDKRRNEKRIDARAPIDTGLDALEGLGNPKNDGQWAGPAVDRDQNAA